MRTPAKRCGQLGLIVLLGLMGRPVRAAERPLLVVVEAPPALDVDATEVRRAVGAELRCETVAPLKTPGDPPERVLIVALDRDRITMSLRAGDLAPLTRSIPSPPEPAARLRTIGWLAGNLARDQVSPIVAESGGAPLLPPMPDLPALPPPGPAASGAPPPPAVPSVEPPAFEAPPATVTAHFDPTPVRRSPWTIGAAAGPAVSTYQLGHDVRQTLFGHWPASHVTDFLSETNTTWRVELQHHTDGSRLFTGLALDGSTGDSDAPEIVGAAALAGSVLQWGRWSLQASLGAGVDLEERMGTFLTASHSSQYGFTSSITNESSVRPGLFAAGALALSHPVFASLDMVLSVDAHLSIIDENDGYLAAMLGIRYAL